MSIPVVKETSIWKATSPERKKSENDRLQDTDLKVFVGIYINKKAERNWNTPSEAVVVVKVIERRLQDWGCS